MNILFMDTSCRTLTVGAIFEGKAHSVVKDAGSGMSSMLMPAVVAVLSECGARVSDMDAVAAVVGPGSFTGIRIGAAAATALTMASGAKRIAVTNFELIAYGRGAVRAAVGRGVVPDLSRKGNGGGSPRGRFG